ncbi:hypothetical protein E2C01_014506 [Portunus trituberculatus]|uniref:Uncharacterized protein n=1 Tax=Portunus trituberculatus TaxID=210409 RepID=A0A5B7DJE6_PORTR|nr:hypothetical protein [Portunus trituberculatus]
MNDMKPSVDKRDKGRCELVRDDEHRQKLTVFRKQTEKADGKVLQDIRSHNTRTWRNNRLCAGITLGWPPNTCPGASLSLACGGAPPPLPPEMRAPRLAPVTHATTLEMSSKV